MLTAPIILLDWEEIADVRRQSPVTPASDKVYFTAAPANRFSSGGVDTLPGILEMGEIVPYLLGIPDPRSLTNHALRSSTQSLLLSLMSDDAGARLLGISSRPRRAR
jgi:hypothetical protein